MTHSCELLELQPQPTLIVRTRTAVQDLPQVLGQAYDAILQHLNDLGELPYGAPFVAYHNMDMENLDIEVGFPTGKPLPGKEAVRPGEIPGGSYAVTMHTGPYPGLASAYDALTTWVRANRYEATGVAYEIYLNDPEQTAPADLQTQILFPLK